MKAPKRLLMIYLLRTTAAAFANSRTAPSKTSRSAEAVLLRAYTSSSSSSGSSVANGDHPSPSSSSPRPLLTSGHITFRLARSSDVPQIQACNLATLPENYNDHFYMNHMRQWPELALVAEHVPDGCPDPTREGEHDNNDGAAVTPLRDYLGRVRKGASSSSSPPQHSTPKREIVGYILGKVEERPILHPPVRRNNLPPSSVAPLYEGPYHNDGGNTPPSWSKPTTSPPWEKLGHVTSLAVHSHARRLGIASSLLRQLHYHLHECYSAHAVGLHVRLSNAAAVKLYVETLGYDVADIIPMYYGDGEDAYFMRKELGEGSREDDVVVVGRRGEASRRGGGGGGGRESSSMQSSSRRGPTVPEWVNRDTRSSFFENRTSMRDMLSSEERAWIDSNRGGGRIAGSRKNESQSSFTGKVTKSFRTFLHGNEEPRRFVNHKNFRSLENWQSRPPWETGPEELRLPRYVQIVRSTGTTRNTVENRDSSRKNGISRRGQKEEEEQQDVGVEEYGDARSVAASGTG